MARGAEAVHQHNLVWRLIGDPVQDPGGPGYSVNGDGAYVRWTAQGATLLEIAPLTRTTSYLDPATMRGPTVRWPAQIPTRSRINGYGTYGDQVSFRTDGLNGSYDVYSVNRQGVRTRSVTVQGRGADLRPLDARLGLARWSVPPDRRGPDTSGAVTF